MDLNEHKEHLQTIMEMELKNAKPLDAEGLEKIKILLGLDYVPHIFFNETNIILTDNEEYEKLKSAAKRLEDVLKIEMSPFNIYLFIGNYINCSEIKTILER